MSLKGSLNSDWPKMDSSIKCRRMDTSSTRLTPGSSLRSTDRERWCSTHRTLKIQLIDIFTEANPSRGHLITQAPQSSYSREIASESLRRCTSCMDMVIPRIWCRITQLRTSTASQPPTKAQLEYIHWILTQDICSTRSVPTKLCVQQSTESPTTFNH